MFLEIDERSVNTGVKKAGGVNPKGADYKFKVKKPERNWVYTRATCLLKFKKNEYRKTTK